MTAWVSSSMWLQGIGVCGSELNTWPDTRAILRGERALPTRSEPIPLCPNLPAAERRRASKVVNLAMGAALEAVRLAKLDAAALPTVFATSSADGENCTAICTALASPDPNDHLISPTRFQNSVQNAAAGYWAIAMRSMSASTTLNAYDGSFSAALLEAGATLGTGAPHVLMTVFDAPYPEPLNHARPIGTSLGIALALSTHPTPDSLARLRIGLTAMPSDRLTLEPLDAVRRSSPPARGLPLLDRIARLQQGGVTLDYLDDLRLAVEVDPA